MTPFFVRTVRGTYRTCSPSLVKIGPFILEIYLRTPTNKTTNKQTHRVNPIHTCILPYRGCKYNTILIDYRMGKSGIIKGNSVHQQTELEVSSVREATWLLPTSTCYTFTSLVLNIGSLTNSLRGFVCFLWPLTCAWKQTCFRLANFTFLYILVIACWQNIIWNYE